MSENTKGFDVRAVWRLSLSVWARHLVVFVALSSMSLLFSQLLRGAANLSLLFWPEATPLAASGGLLALILLGIAANGFVTLLVVNHLRGYLRGPRPIFSETFVAARRMWGRYVASVLMLLALALFALSLAAVLIEAGRKLYILDQTNLAAFVGTHLAAVIFIIATGWYGFYFSLGPLVGACEAKGPFAAFRESRRRIRGHMFGYLSALALFVLGCGAIVTGACLGLIRLGGERMLLSWVDPLVLALLVFFSPLWLAVWYTSYEQLTRLKKETAPSD